MEIKDHLLEGSNIDFRQSPNHGGKFSGNSPDSIIIHYTAGSSAKSSIETLCNPKTKASAHLVVSRDGAVTQLVPFDTIAWHAGKSAYQGRIGFNKYSIGIEIDNAGRLTKSGSGYTSWFGRKYDVEDVVEAVHRNEREVGFWHSYSEKQIAAVSLLCETLIGTYSINAILGHEEIAPKRKSDPGPAFPLDKLREHLLNSDRSQEEAEDPVSASLKKTGLVTASKLNIRDSSNGNGRIVAPPLTKGSLVDIVGEQNGWYQIEYKTKGWVSGQYVKS